jgi:hypothetical protein
MCPLAAHIGMGVEKIRRFDTEVTFEFQNEPLHGWQQKTGERFRSDSWSPATYQGSRLQFTYSEQTDRY